MKKLISLLLALALCLSLCACGKSEAVKNVEASIIVPSMPVPTTSQPSQKELYSPLRLMAKRLAVLYFNHHTQH